MNKVKFCSFGGYRRFCRLWWCDLWWYVTVGWYHDIKSYWLRANYGWAPRDTWNLYSYWAKMMAGSLKYLAEHNHGAPAGYPLQEGVTYDTPTDFEKFKQDCLKWADAFYQVSLDESDLFGNSPYYSYEQIDAITKKRSEDLHTTLKEMEPWFESLWD